MPLIKSKTKAKKLLKPKNATKKELAFIDSLQQGINAIKGKPSKGVIKERHKR